MKLLSGLAAVRVVFMSGCVLRPRPNFYRCLHFRLNACEEGVPYDTITIYVAGSECSMKRMHA